MEVGLAGKHRVGSVSVVPVGSAGGGADWCGPVQDRGWISRDRWGGEAKGKQVM